MKTVKFIVGVLFAAVLGGATLAEAPSVSDGDAQLRVKLELDNAVTDRTMYVTLLRDANGWGRAIPSTPRFNKGAHEAVVTESAASEEAITLTLYVMVGSDGWVGGGRAKYRVELKRTDDAGRYEGSQEGEFQGKPCAGAARAAVSLGRGYARTDVRPVQGEEHPRLLFRRQDLTALKKKAATPFGKAALSRIDGPIGLGLRFQLEGDPKYADQAIPLVKAMMAETTIGDKRVRARVFGWRMEQIALAYDLCFEAWPESFRGEVGKFFLQDGARPFAQLSTFHQEIAWIHRGPYPGEIRYGAALGALAMLGRKGPAPEPPTEPAVRIREVAPDAAYRAGEGVTVCAFQNDTMPPEWILSTGFKPAPDEDPFKTVGGIAKARPQVGDVVECEGRSEAFRKLEHDEEKGHYGNKLELVRATGRNWRTVSYLFAVVKNDANRLVQVRTGDPRDRVYLAGVETKDGDFVEIKPGVYPMLVSGPIGKTTDWGVIFKQPRLSEVGRDVVEAKLAEDTAAYEWKHKFWQYEHDMWERTGGGDVGVLRLFEVARSAMADYCEEGFYGNGYKAAHLYSISGPAKYVAAYRNAMCRNVTPAADIERFLPRQMFMTLFGEGADTTLFQDIMDSEGFCAEEYGGRLDFTANAFAGLFPVVDEEYRPAVLWAWNRYLGVKDSANPVEVLVEAERPGLPGYPGASLPAWAFVNYPLGEEAKPPQGILPLTWQTTDWESYAFRNRWLGDNACLFQIAVKPGCDSGGALRLAGFGQRWVLGDVRNRMFESVVQLPDVELRKGGEATTLRARQEANGSGNVTLDLTGLYETDENGFRATRSVAVDCSGKSGAPLLLAVADRVAGGSEPVWWLPFKNGGFTCRTVDLSDWAKKKEDKAGAAEVKAAWDEAWKAIDEFYATSEEWKQYASEREALLSNLHIEGNRFTITKGEVVLTAHVYSDRPVTIRTDDLDSKWRGGHNTPCMTVCSGLGARGGSEYLVVMTLGKGAAPEVKADGAGLKAKVRVGGAIVETDGENAVIR